MKRHFLRLTLLLAACLTAGTSQTVLADTPHLQATIGGTQKDNVWFFCLPRESGCFSLHAATQGKQFPLSAGRIQQAFLLNTHTLRMASVPLPSDCAANVDEGQILKLTGDIHIDSHRQASISHLHCRITG